VQGKGREGKYVRAFLRRLEDRRYILGVQKLADERWAHLVIRDDVPLPDVPQRNRTGLTQVLRRMKPGQSVEIPGQPESQPLGTTDARMHKLRQMAYQVGHRHGMDFYVRRTGPDTLTVWRCHP